MDNDKVFRHFCTTMGWLPGSRSATPTSTLSKLPNAMLEGYLPPASRAHMTSFLIPFTPSNSQNPIHSCTM